MTEPTWLSAGASTASGETGVLIRPRYGRPDDAITIQRELVLGRADTCDVVLADPVVSRRHARIWRSDGRFGVEDVGSSNGTYVNGQRITSPQELRDGDRLTLGDAELRFRLVADAVVPHIPLQQNGSRRLAYQGPTRSLPAQRPAEGSVGSQDGVGVKSLSLAILASLVGVGVSQAFGTGKPGAFAFAVIAPLLAATFTMRRGGKESVGPVTLVTAAAVALTVLGITVADFTVGRSVFPWNHSGSTFVPVPAEGTAWAPKVKMPALAGEDNVSAMQLLVHAGFDPRNVLMPTAPSSQDSFGRVIRTDPAAGSTLPNNAIVTVYIGVGRSVVGGGSGNPSLSPSASALVMPDIVGSSSTSFMGKLQKAGFALGDIVTELQVAPKDQFGKVVRTEPSAGSKAGAGDRVKVFIGGN